MHDSHIMGGEVQGFYNCCAVSTMTTLIAALIATVRSAMIKGIHSIHYTAV